MRARVELSGTELRAVIAQQLGCEVKEIVISLKREIGGGKDEKGSTWKYYEEALITVRADDFAIDMIQSDEARLLYEEE